MRYALAVMTILWFASGRGAADKEVITPCARGSAAHTAAWQALQQFAQRVEVLQDGEPVGSLERELKALLGSRCFLMSSENPRSVTIESAQALRAFWRRGGDIWLGSYLDGTRPREVVLPPDMRRTLGSADLPQELLCPEGDARCTAETAGWLLRASWALAGKEPTPLDVDENKQQRAAVSQACWQQAQQSPDKERYFRWRACVEEKRPLVPALPLGAARAPAKGLLVLRGRRGHYSFCDELRAYDLATGAAYVAQSCSNLVLRPNGRVDAARTERARKLSVNVGRVSVDNLREAALLIVLAKAAQPTQITSATYPLPAGLSPSWPSGEGFVAGISVRSYGSSGNSEISWAIGDAGKVIAQGTLTWPEPWQPGERYAMRLIQVMEAGFQAGCAPHALPDWLPLAEQKTDWLDQELREQLRTAGRCGPPH